MKKNIEICTLKKNNLINLFGFCSDIFSSKFLLNFKMAIKTMIEIIEKVTIKYHIQNKGILKYLMKIIPHDTPKQGKKSGVIR